MPGVVRRDDGLVHEAPNLGWRDVALGARLASVLKKPVQVANDAELGALAEHVRGLARDVDDLVCVSADYGVGGGVVSGGRPLRGTAGYVGELGHMTVRHDGRACYCGNRGCWETEVGEPALCRALGLPEETPRGVLVAELRSLATAPVAGPLDEFAEWLATGLVTVVNMMAPELVVLGDLFTALPAVGRRPGADGGAPAEPGEPGGRRDADRDLPAGPRREARRGGGAGVRAGARGGVSAASDRAKAAFARLVRANAAVVAAGVAGSGSSFQRVGLVGPHR